MLVGGRPGFVAWRSDGTAPSVLAFTVVDSRITVITVVIDPAEPALMDVPDPA